MKRTTNKLMTEHVIPRACTWQNPVHTEFINIPVIVIPWNTETEREARIWEVLNPLHRQSKQSTFNWEQKEKNLMQITGIIKLVTRLLTSHAHVQITSTQNKCRLSDPQPKIAN